MTDYMRGGIFGGMTPIDPDSAARALENIENQERQQQGNDLRFDDVQSQDKGTNTSQSEASPELEDLLRKYFKHYNAYDGEIEQTLEAIHQLIATKIESELMAVQVYTDPSHQTMSPYTRLKTADMYINERLERLRNE